MSHDSGRSPDSNPDEPVDLSVLDPLKDPVRWQDFMQHTLHRVDLALAQQKMPEDPFALIASWRRPLVLAALAASVVIGAIELALERREWRAERIQRLVSVSAQWPGTGQPPTGSDFVRALSTTRTGQATP